MRRLGLLLFLAGNLAAVPSAAEQPIAAKRMIVVVPRQWLEAIEPFLVYKRAHGIAAEPAVLEDVLAAGDGRDDPEKLKRFLYHRWQSPGLQFVLLVGDVDVLPVRYMVLDRVTPAAFDYAFYPSDLYYADLAKADGAFESWNARTEDFHAEYWGEVRGEKNKQDPLNYDEVDYLPDVAVGRWPCDTVEELKRAIQKSCRYEDGLRSHAKPGGDRALLLAVDGWVDTRNRLDAVATQLAARWHAEKLFFARGRQSETRLPTEDELYRALSEGAGLVLHTGHGETDRWLGCCTAAGVAHVQNADRLPVMMSAGCSTAYFAPLAPYGPYEDVHGQQHVGTDRGETFAAPPPPPAPYQRAANPTGLGERLLVDSEHGAAAYIGCNTGSQPCAVTLLEGFAAAAATLPSPTLGEAWNHALAEYHRRERLAELRPDKGWYPPSIFFQGMKFMVFGDPSLPLPGAARTPD